MSGVILESPQAFRTSRALAKELGVESVKRLRLSSDNIKWVFRYGNISYLYHYPPLIINRKDSILSASDKYRAKELFMDCGIPIPRLYTIHDLETEEINFPIIARPRNHYKGRHFYIVEDIKTATNYFMRGFYLQDIVDNKDEYRVFIWRDKVFEVNIKKKTREGNGNNELIRNFDNGWSFYFQPVSETKSIIKDFCRMAIRHLQLDWGAVDCCIDTNGKFYMFEVNSAPSLIDRKIKKLADKVREFVNSRVGGSEARRDEPVEDVPVELDRESVYLARRVRELGLDLATDEDING